MKFQGKMTACMMLVTAILFTASCSRWEKDKDEDDEDDKTVQVTGSGGSGGSSRSKRKGDVYVQKINVQQGQAVDLSFAAFGLVQDAETENSGSLEISISRPDGQEERYVRRETSDASVDFIPDQDGEYEVTIRNNGDESTSVTPSAIEGGDVIGSPENAVTRADARFRDVTLKAVVAFARQCKRYTADGNGTDVWTAPEGSYYAQPFVFLGKIDAAAKVTPIVSATIKLKLGATELPLRRLAEFDLAVYREHGGLDRAAHEIYTRNFYQGYFGAAGEMYTVDTFRFGGDCASAPTFALGPNVGETSVILTIEDGDLGLAEEVPVRATEGAAFSTYLSNDQRIDDWTQCTYDPNTGEPTPYNGDGICKTFSVADAPYVKLDYRLPSGADAANPASSDPTRVVYYGHGFAKTWKKALISQSAAIISGAVSSVVLPGCLVTGGMVPVPLGASRTYLPLDEFNAGPDDILNVARRTGSYTALTDFYQGNVDVSGEIVQATCVPTPGESCGDFRQLTVVQTACAFRADSGVTALSIGDSFIYPEYFEMSGVLAP